jgi:putative endonuclease
MKNKRKFGGIGEDIACAFLEKQGFSVTGRNVHFGHIETDIICENDEYILFVEVKTRTDAEFSLRFGRPASAVTKTKLEKGIVHIKNVTG